MLGRPLTRHCSCTVRHYGAPPHSRRLGSTAVLWGGEACAPVWRLLPPAAQQARDWAPTVFLKAFSSGVLLDAMLPISAAARHPLTGSLHAAGSAVRCSWRQVLALRCG